VIAQILHHTGHRPGTDLTLRFVEHFAAIKQALDDRGLWDETDGLYYDRLITPGGDRIEMKVRSMVALLPALALRVVGQETVDLAQVVGKRSPRCLPEPTEATERDWSTRQRGLPAGSRAGRVPRVNALFEIIAALAGLLGAEHSQHPDADLTSTSQRYSRRPRQDQPTHQHRTLPDRVQTA
jgi:hypothetical protein